MPAWQLSRPPASSRRSARCSRSCTQPTRLRRTWTPWCLSSSLIYARGSRSASRRWVCRPAPTDPGAIRDPRGRDDIRTDSLRDSSKRMPRSRWPASPRWRLTTSRSPVAHSVASIDSTLVRHVASARPAGQSTSSRGAGSATRRGAAETRSGSWRRWPVLTRVARASRRW